MTAKSWIHRRFLCKKCQYEIVVTQATESDCDYWYYCSNKTCPNHHPGEQLGDMEEFSFGTKPYKTSDSWDNCTNNHAEAVLTGKSCLCRNCFR